MKHFLCSAASLLCALFSINAQNYCESTADGEIQSNIWNCHGTATRPTASGFSGDSLVVKHTVTWGTSQNGIINWTSSQMRVLSVRAGGKIGPSINNNELMLPQGAIVKLYTGSSISPLSGNNSNHALIIGGTCIWGKKCCPGNNTINGPYQLNGQTPCAFVALPVSLLSFTCKTTDGIRYLNWTTAFENNISYYMLEESENASADNWKTVGTIPAKVNPAGSSEYNYTLSHFARSTITAYRLSQTELNGETEILKTITISNTGEVSAVISQNKNGISIIAGQEFETLSVNISDLYGKTLFSQSCVSNSSAGFEIPFSGYAPGMYIITVTNPADKAVMTTQKLVWP